MSRGGSGPSQRRFKQVASYVNLFTSLQSAEIQFKERRKSLGISNDLSMEFVTLFGSSSRQSEAGASDCKGGDAAASHKAASGHVEVDECLSHHLRHASMTLKVRRAGDYLTL